MKIFISADHNGFAMKNELKIYLERSGYEVADTAGPTLDTHDDYPVAAAKLAHELLASGNKNNRAILICGSGQGVCIAANRFKGIRACLCWDNREAKASRNDDNSNVLCLPARMMTTDKARSITHVWLTTPFAGAERFKRRIAQLDTLG